GRWRTASRTAWPRSPRRPATCASPPSAAREPPCGARGSPRTARTCWRWSRRCAGSTGRARPPGTCARSAARSAPSGCARWREANRAAAERLRRKLGPRAAGLPLGGLFRTAREASLEDPFLFFLALSMAEHELVLSYPETNEQGNPTVPSPFLDEVQATAAGPLPRAVLDPTALVPPGEECCELAELVGRASLARWARHAEAPPDRLTAALAGARP